MHRRTTLASALAALALIGGAVWRGGPSMFFNETVIGRYRPGGSNVLAAGYAFYKLSRSIFACDYTAPPDAPKVYDLIWNS